MLIFRDIRRQYIRRYLLLLLLLSFTKTGKHFEGESKKPNRKHETQKNYLHISSVVVFYWRHGHVIII